MFCSLQLLPHVFIVQTLADKAVQTTCRILKKTNINKAQYGDEPAKNIFIVKGNLI